MAPRAGFEPATIRLTVECSTAELPGNVRSVLRNEAAYNKASDACKAEMPTRHPRTKADGSIGYPSHAVHVPQPKENAATNATADKARSAKACIDQGGVLEHFRF